MKHTRKSLSLLLVFTLTISGLMTIESAYAQSIPKPSVPEFALKVVADPYDVAPSNIEITIKNQHFNSYTDASGNYASLYYNVRFKGHFSQQWSYYPENRSSGYAKASISDYTTLSFALGGSPLGNIPAGGLVDFQIQALTGHDDLESYLYQFTGQISDWSNTQTITIPETSPSVSASPTVAPSLTSTQVSISVDTSSATVGASVNINGKLTDTNGNPLPNKIVTLSYNLAENSYSVPIGSDTTSAGGEYNLQWVNTASGTFTLTVDWSGDTVFQPSSNSTTLNFLPYQNQNVFWVESNSTVTALAYNSTSSELSFSVTGTSETTGYVKVTLAKSLRSYPENIKVYLDRNQLNYLVTSNADSWQLTFNYHHSTHQVAITLGSASSASSTTPAIASTSHSPSGNLLFEPITIVIAVVIVLLVATIMTLLLVLKRRTIKNQYPLRRVTTNTPHHFFTFLAYLPESKGSVLAIRY